MIDFLFQLLSVIEKSTILVHKPFLWLMINMFFLNRDLSWLSFNHRVLMEAADKTVPLYSRISFLSIFSSNLDEFFRVRMPSIFAFTSIESKKDIVAG